MRVRLSEKRRCNERGRSPPPRLAVAAANDPQAALAARTPAVRAVCTPRVCARGAVRRAGRGAPRGGKREEAHDGRSTPVS